MTDDNIYNISTFRKFCSDIILHSQVYKQIDCIILDKVLIGGGLDFDMNKKYNKSTSNTL